MNLKIKAPKIITKITHYLDKKGVGKRRLIVLTVFLAGIIAFYSPLEVKIEKIFLECIQFKTYEESKNARNRVLALKYTKAKPLRVRQIEEPRIEARSALVVLVKEGEERVLFEKHAKKSFPVASLTKLMSGLIVAEQYDLNQTLTLSEKAASQEGGPNFFKTGEEFYIRDLLYSSLVESSNRAIFALAELKGEEEFVHEMNKKARELGMYNTQFFNPTGLDPEFPYEIPNYSTADDLVRLAKRLSGNKLLIDICRTKIRNIYSASGWFHHQMETTNKLLDSFPGLLIAKTGRTPTASQCLLLAFKSKGDDLLIGVVLGAKDNFKEMETLTDWINQAYKW